LRGFTLIEVLVAILVVALGLLGLSKMQALAISNTQVASVRSLISLQASSLAAAMQSNRVYWAGILPANAPVGTAALAPPASFSATGKVVTNGPTASSTNAACSSATLPTTAQCSATELAAADLQLWATTMNSLFPSYSAKFVCSNTASTSTAPVTCSITISWSEKYVALNNSTATGSTAQTATQSFTLYVTP
jgi:type IV pilus assembly protein PilV